MTDLPPKRIQRRRTKGWRFPAGAIYVGRPTNWGNPYTASSAMEAGYKDGAKMAVWAFRQWLAGVQGWGDKRDERRAVILARVAELRGHDLACWCGLCPEHQDGLSLGVKCEACAPCHATVLLELANG